MDGNNYTEVTSFNISPAYDVVIQIPDNTIARYVWVRCTEVVSAEFFCTEQWTVTGQSLIYAGFKLRIGLTIEGELTGFALIDLRLCDNVLHGQGGHVDIAK